MVDITIIFQRKEITLDKQLLILFGCLFAMALVFWWLFRRMVKLLTFEPLAKELFPEHRKSDFMNLMSKLRRGKTLSKFEQTKLDAYARVSGLPKNFVTRQQGVYKPNFSERLVLIIIILWLIIRLGIKPKRNEHSSDQ